MSRSFSSRVGDSSCRVRYRFESARDDVCFAARDSLQSAAERFGEHAVDVVGTGGSEIVAQIGCTHLEVGGAEKVMHALVLLLGFAIFPSDGAASLGT